MICRFHVNLPGCIQCGSPNSGFHPLFIHVTRGFGRSQHLKTYRKTHRSRDRHRSFHFSSEGNQRIHPRDALTLQVGSKKCTFTLSICKYTAVFSTVLQLVLFPIDVPVWHPEISAHCFCRQFLLKRNP